ncbi:5274_t:CDS:2 [Funneliformis mosseae]|uniref:DNA polymerase epsilon subunit D n=1 Tax=Funneliformis mosseae TaxID=27381 RepID=A0A9N8VI87_FUNMO|nr:5274_t:CDS:2 [Funneliformis mosseae]
MLSSEDFSSDGEVDYDKVIKEIEDMDMPNAIITKLINNADDAKLAVVRSTTAFISHITTAANQVAKSKNRKNIQPVDLFKALEKGEFEEFLPRLKEELNLFQTVQRNKKFDKVIQSVEEEELSRQTSNTVINAPSERVIVEILPHNGITNDLSNSDNNETTETDIDSGSGSKGKRRHSKLSKRIIEVVSVNIENISNISPTINGKMKQESNETSQVENNIEKNDLLDDGSDLTSNIGSSNDEGTSGAE